MDPATITPDSFTLTRHGESTPVPATVTYDPGTKTATLNPASDLASAAGYKVTVKGGAAGPKSLAGKETHEAEFWSFLAGDAPLVVTKTADSDKGICLPDDCSLREAVATANSGARLTP